MSQREEEIAAARWMLDHPDTGAQQKRLLRALLEEIDAGRARLRAAIKYSAAQRLRAHVINSERMMHQLSDEQLNQLGRC
jgi:hypothetical protein